MLEIFQYSFMVKAFIAGIALSLVAPAIGTFLVARRYSLIADTLSHVSLAGVAIGLFAGIYPLYTALGAAIIATFIIERLRSNAKLSGETALAMLLSGSLALAIVLIGIARGFTIDLFSYLFGSITTVSETDIVVMLPLSALVLCSVFLFYKEFLYISFDEESAQVAGIRVRLLNMILLVLTAITVALSIRIVGVLLIGALMVIPVVTGTQVGKSFRKSFHLSLFFSFVSVIGGLFLSYYLNLPAGGTIVLLSLGLFGLVSFIK